MMKICTLYESGTGKVQGHVLVKVNSEGETIDLAYTTTRFQVFKTPKAARKFWEERPTAEGSERESIWGPV